MFCTRNPHVKKFLAIAIEDLKHHHIKIKLYRRTIDPKFEIDGYFDDCSMELGIYKNYRWLETFVHEYAHFLQWKQDESTFAAYYKYDYDPVKLVENYVQRKVAYCKKVKNAFNVIRRNEACCDKLAANLIKKYDLPINLEKYRREANRQIVFYHCVELKRSWEPSNKFYGDLLGQMIPSKIKKSYAEKLPKQILKTALKLF